MSEDYVEPSSDSFWEVSFISSVYSVLENKLRKFQFSKLFSR